MRHFSLITLLVVLLVVAPIGATATETPTGDGLDAEDVRTIIQDTDPGDADLETIRDVAGWARSANVSDQLGRDDARALQDWLTEATSQPNLDVDDVQLNVTSGASTATATATPTASPQPTANQPAPISTPNATETERIDSDTVLVASEWNETAGTARITIRSETSQSVTLSDAGRFAQGGKVPTTTHALRAGTTSTIEIAVTEVDGRVGVAISTERTPLYSEIIQSSSGDGLGILSAVSKMQAWLGGVTIAFVWMVIAGYSVMRREGGRPEVAT